MRKSFGTSSQQSWMELESMCGSQVGLLVDIVAHSLEQSKSKPVVYAIVSSLRILQVKPLYFFSYTSIFPNGSIRLSRL